MCSRTWGNVTTGAGDRAHETTVVIGNGPAAVHACRALRERGYAGCIRLISDHPEPPYNPMLTPYYLAGGIARAGCFPWGGRELYSSLRVEAHLGVPVVALDAQAHTIELADGTRMEYAQCLVAVGASAVVPPVPGLAGPRVFLLRTVRHADSLRRALAGGASRALVLGASMVGLKTAEVLHAAGLEVVLADLAPHVLSLAAHESCARLIETHLVEAGVELRLGEGMAAVETAAAGRLHVEFTGGPPVDADLVVVAVGVRPNLDFIDRGQVESDVGLIVDDYLRTSAPDLYAAGDVAQATNLLTGRKAVVGLFANACLQGRTAGRVMAGDEEAYPGSLPCNVIHVMGLTFTGVGDAAAAPVLVERLDSEAGTYCRLSGREGRLSGVNLLNSCAGGGITRHAGPRGARRVRGGDGGLPAWAGVRVPQRAWAGFCDRLTEHCILGETSGAPLAKEGS